MFGKTVAQYLGFQKVLLVLIVLAFLVRLTLSLAGTPNSAAKWISVTVVLLAGIVYYGVAVHTRGFGSYKQLYPLVLFQSVLGEGLVALAIVLAIFTGRDNIYTAPEYSGGGDGKNWLHVRDGSGAEGTNDLTVTTSTKVKVGDLVLVTGVLKTDRDFGGGYKYSLIVEDANVAVE